ncbi:MULTISPECIES: LacI family DNA-binding transcriptional regulator [Sphingobacterium]|uniref:LacI family DNA-binding transcriptional regulator n=1 Tax=Sphingobacterium populi TaxID=1812824 RepID=A0ABW5UC07_9SPHI|nr:LacI family DNA-binding transcriptional regulator [Sphingobacterium sp. CFCC 11742]
MKKRTTIYDIAKALNTTISTVSRALNNSDLISDTTKDAVRKMAEELNYRPNKVASSLSSGKTYIIGVIVPSAQIHFFSSFISALELHFKRAGYSIILYQSNESLQSEQNGIATLLEAQVDGVIISPSLETTDFSHLHKVHEEHKALLVFDRIDDRISAPKVAIDDYRAGYLATSHLIKQGYRRIAYVSTASTIKIFEDRYEGYIHALQEHGLSVDPRLVIREGISIEAGINATRHLLNQPRRPDAIIGGDDFTALGVLNVLNEGQIDSGEIGVVGFANQTFSAYINPSLTTIDQQAEKMGEESARLFLTMLQSADPVGLSTTRVILDPILIVRDSTRKN